jgi:hypothetical protein
MDAHGALLKVLEDAKEVVRRQSRISYRDKGALIRANVKTDFGIDLDAVAMLELWVMS